MTRKRFKTISSSSQQTTPSLQQARPPSQQSTPPSQQTLPPLQQPTPSSQQAIRHSHSKLPYHHSNMMNLRTMTKHMMILEFVKTFTIPEPPLGDIVKAGSSKIWEKNGGTTNHRSEAEKQSRSLHMSVHAAGSKSFARHAQELEKEKQVPINRADLYKVVHSRSDGSPMNPDVAEKIKFTNFEPIRMGGSISWSPSDRYAQVIGPERHGRIRGVGLGPIPSSHPTNANIIFTQPASSNNTKMIELQDKMKMMESTISSLQSTIQMMAKAWEQRENQNVANPNLDQLPPTIPSSSHASRKTFHDNFDGEDNAIGGSADDTDSAGVDGAGAGAKLACV
ncbi:hypothetical protein CJ030_MR8G024582 [Morella rubra]|uniref:Uncharacterized protein n=1 Tax=Morella rubra TaxID=262757 RepID=A0A6A1UTD0_9ROSI|nr:hypothetical protein CJ030_MR8G024582 [Morella rubra]